MWLFHGKTLHVAKFFDIFIIIKIPVDRRSFGSGKLVSSIITTPLLPPPLLLPPQSRLHLTYVEHRCAALLLPAAQAVIELQQGPKASSLPQQCVCIMQ
jgi:hypothetical protein